MGQLERANLRLDGWSLWTPLARFSKSRSMPRALAGANTTGRGDGVYVERSKVLRLILRVFGP